MSLPPPQRLDLPRGAATDEWLAVSPRDRPHQGIHALEQLAELRPQLVKWRARLEHARDSVSRRRGQERVDELEAQEDHWFGVAFPANGEGLPTHSCRYCSRLIGPKQWQAVQQCGICESKWPSGGNAA